MVYIGVTMKNILTDCDGVLLDWQIAFHEWMKAKGHVKSGSSAYDIDLMYPDLGKQEAQNQIKTFNESAWMCCLPTFKDADQGIAKLFNHDYRFTVITSLSTDPYAKKIRWMNLDNNFGEDAFDDLVCLKTGGAKDEALEPYRNSGLYWIEDKWENAVLGADLGLRPIIITHEHNRLNYDPRVTRVNNWREICDLILSEEQHDAA
jgi:hypothetical protein